MGFDYYCPKCGGPAYGSSDDRPCSACTDGYPSYVNCSCGSYVSTVREGYSTCSKSKCNGYTCNKCDICLDCYIKQIMEKNNNYRALKKENSRLKKENIELKQKLTEFNIDFESIDHSDRASDDSDKSETDF
jgi:hypothetical protein